MRRQQASGCKQAEVDADADSRIAWCSVDRAVEERVFGCYDACYNPSKLAAISTKTLLFVLDHHFFGTSNHFICSNIQVCVFDTPTIRELHLSSVQVYIEPQDHLFKALVLRSFPTYAIKNNLPLLSSW